MDFAPLDSFSLDKNQISTVKYANFGERLLAYIIDTLILAVPVFLSVLTFAFGTTTYVILVGFLTMLYKPVLEGLYGHTLGKKVLGLKVVDDSHQIIDLGTSFVRNSFFVLSSIVNIIPYFLLADNSDFLDAESFLERATVQQAAQGLILNIVGYSISILILVSCLFVAFDKKKYQALHDKFASTYVIKNNPFG